MLFQRVLPQGWGLQNLRHLHHFQNVDAFLQALVDPAHFQAHADNLGNGLSSRYAHTGRLEDLEEAIRVYRQAVRRTPPDSPDSDSGN